MTTVHLTQITVASPQREGAQMPHVGSTIAFLAAANQKPITLIEEQSLWISCTFTEIVDDHSEHLIGHTHSWLRDARLV